MTLGTRVWIIEAKIDGIITKHTRCLDGTENWTVEFWHDGNRCTIKCEARELKPVDGPQGAPA